MAEGSNGKRTAAMVLSALLALLFLFAGGSKLAGSEEVASNFGRFGYPVAFAYLIGLAEVGGALLLFAPAMARYAAGLLIAIMLGASASHFMVGDPMPQPIVPLVIAALLALVVYLRRPA